MRKAWFAFKHILDTLSEFGAQAPAAPIGFSISEAASPFLLFIGSPELRVSNRGINDSWYFGNSIGYRF